MSRRNGFHREYMIDADPAPPFPKCKNCGTRLERHYGEFCCGNCKERYNRRNRI